MDFVKKYEQEEINVLDVRKASEYASQHIEGAVNLSLDFINDHMDELNLDNTYYLHCQGGYRSVIAASILKARGFNQLVNVEGGFNEIKKNCVNVTEYHEPATML